MCNTQADTVASSYGCSLKAIWRDSTQQQQLEKEDAVVDSTVSSLLDATRTARRSQHRHTEQGAETAFPRGCRNIQIMSSTRSRSRSRYNKDNKDEKDKGIIPALCATVYPKETTYSRLPSAVTVRPSPSFVSLSLLDAIAERGQTPASANIPGPHTMAGTKAPRARKSRTRSRLTRKDKNQRLHNTRSTDKRPPSFHPTLATTDEPELQVHSAEPLAEPSVTSGASERSSLIESINQYDGYNQQLQMLQHRWNDACCLQQLFKQQGQVMASIHGDKIVLDSRDGKSPLPHTPSKPSLSGSEDHHHHDRYHHQDPQRDDDDLNGAQCFDQNSISSDTKGSTYATTLSTCTTSTLDMACATHSPPGLDQINTSTSTTVGTECDHSIDQTIEELERFTALLAAPLYENDDEIRHILSTPGLRQPQASRSIAGSDSLPSHEPHETARDGKAANELGHNDKVGIIDNIHNVTATINGNGNGKSNNEDDKQIDDSDSVQFDFDGTDSEIANAIQGIRKEASRVNIVMALDQLSTLRTELATASRALDDRSVEINKLHSELNQRDGHIAQVELERDLFQADVEKLKEDLQTCVDNMFDIVAHRDDDSTFEEILSQRTSLQEGIARNPRLNPSVLEEDDLGLDRRVQTMRHSPLKFVDQNVPTAVATVTPSTGFINFSDGLSHHDARTPESSRDAIDTPIPSERQAQLLDVDHQQHTRTQDLHASLTLQKSTKRKDGAAEAIFTVFEDIPASYGCGGLDALPRLPKFPTAISKARTARSDADRPMGAMFGSRSTTVAASTDNAHMVRSDLKDAGVTDDGFGHTSTTRHTQRAGSRISHLQRQVDRDVLADTSDPDFHHAQRSYRPRHLPSSRPSWLLSHRDEPTTSHDDDDETEDEDSLPWDAHHMFPSSPPRIERSLHSSLSAQFDDMALTDRGRRCGFFFWKRFSKHQKAIARLQERLGQMHDVLQTSLSNEQRSRQELDATKKCYGGTMQQLRWKLAKLKMEKKERETELLRYIQALEEQQWGPRSMAEEIAHADRIEAESVVEIDNLMDIGVEVDMDVGVVVHDDSSDEEGIDKLMI